MHSLKPSRIFLCMMRSPKYDRPFIDFENPDHCEDAVLTRFLKNISRGSEWRINVINHFHSSIDDIHIIRLREYFETYLNFCSIHPSTYTKSRFYCYDHLYHRRDGKLTTDHVRIGIMLDNLWNENRIVSIHVMDRYYKSIRNTIFTLPRNRSRTAIN